MPRERAAPRRGAATKVKYVFEDDDEIISVPSVQSEDDFHAIDHGQGKDKVLELPNVPPPPPPPPPQQTPVSSGDSETFAFSITNK
ncbi:unnamed protein product [Protopolystoma xenopodis]|uniref:Uncharacterized protein n=1 Tax=Protopolystoma xenopodis TaxID=117903 RepID=A0A3S5CQC7_9PLAT|nr:unnamed protein product [Protopolystoma xenopodis]